MPWHTDPKAFASMVRTKDWKLVVSHSIRGEGELYDLVTDPGEHLNLYADPAFLEKKTELMECLLRHWSHTADPVPVRKSDW
jgi:arylsulfatase A-like enzyme